MFLNLRHLYIICSAIKDGYESDGALVFKRRESQNTPRSQTPAEAKTAYNQIQKGMYIRMSTMKPKLFGIQIL